MARAFAVQQIGPPHQGQGGVHLDHLATFLTFYGSPFPKSSFLKGKVVMVVISLAGQRFSR